MTGQSRSDFGELFDLPSDFLLVVCDLGNDRGIVTAFFHWMQKIAVTYDVFDEASGTQLLDNE